MKHFVKAGLAVLMAAALSLSACAESWSAAVLGDSVTLYANSSLSAVVSTAPKYTILTVESVSGDVAKVQTGNLTAYARASELTAVKSFAQAAALNKDAKVYASPSTKAKSAKYAKGTKVYILGTKGSWSMIERNGGTGYIQSKYLTDISEDAFGGTDDDGTPFGATDTVINADTRVYKSASTASKSAKVKKGTTCKLISTSGSWSYVWKDGVYAYIPSKYLGTAADPTTEPDTDTSYMSSSKYTNEQKCYLFLTKELGLNTAAAAGLLANFYRECSFNPKCGTSHYGLAQWSTSLQKELKSYCSKNGYDYTSLEGQLRFLRYNLQNSYPTVWAKLTSVSNTAQGAYDAAHYFCYYYERPNNKASAAVSRGNLAKQTYFPKYSG